MNNNFFSELNTSIICKHLLGGLTVDTSVQLHCHNGYEILIFLGGDTSFFVEQHEQSLSPGDIVCCPPYTFHGAFPHSSHDYERILINISESQLNQLSSIQTNLSSFFYSNMHTLNIIHLPEESWTRLIDYCIQLDACLEQQPYGYDVLQPALLTQILVLLNQQSKIPKIDYVNSMSPLVTSIFSFIENNYTQKMTMELLSENLHHNADYLTRCFRKATGCSIQQFIIAKRINHSQKLLREGYNPCEVCFLSGFQNYSNFSRAFTQHIGISPKQYQRLHN